MTSRLQLRDVTVHLRGAPVLTGLDVDVATGQCRAVVGLNGAGKSTTLRVALGMLTPSAGEVRILGHPIASAPREIWGQVGHLVDGPACYGELTARENIACSADLHGADRARARTTTEMMAETLGLGPWLDTPVHRLSFGTRQKVGLVSALVHEPRLVILDEPTNGLDPLAVVAFRQLLAGVTAGGGSVLITSHHFDELARVANTVDVLHRGRVITSLRPDGSDLERTFFDTILAADRDRVSTP